MSDPRIVHIPCCAGNNLHGECQPRLHGDLVQLLGLKDMQFLPEDATRLAVELNRIATEIKTEGEALAR